MELALARGFQNVRSADHDTPTSPRLFQAGDQPRVPSGKGPTLPSRERAPHPNPRAAPASPLLFPNWWVWTQAPGSAPRRGRRFTELTQGPLPEDGVNRLSLKVTSSGSGSGGQRKLQSFFRAVNARRKTQQVTAPLRAPRPPSAVSQGISLPNRDAFFKPEPGIDLE